VEKLLGFKPEERIGVNVFDRIHPDDLKFASNAFNTFILNTSSKDINSPVRQIRLRHQDGSWHTFETAASKLLHNNIVEAVIINLRDISERKQAEAQRQAAIEVLRESENRFRAQYNGNPIPTFTWQKQGDEFFLKDFNDSAKIFTVGQRNSFLGRQASEMYKNRWEILGNLKKCFDEKRIISIESISEHFMPGKLVMITFVFVPPDLVMVHLEDISERRKAENNLRNSEELFRNLFNYHSAVKLIIDPDTGNIIDANKAAVKYYGWPLEQITRMKIQDINILSQEEVKTAMKKVLTRQSTRFEFRHRRADGSIRDVEIFSSSIKAQEKVVLHAIVHDIADRKRAEEELNKYRDHLEELVRERTIRLEASNKELEAFSYSASHDLRAPLRTIGGFSQALLEDYEDKLDVQRKDYLIRIRAATEHMAELIEDLLQLSRITRAEMNIEKINLTWIARSVIDELQKSQPQRHVEIRIADGLEETADSRLMRIVLENLLGNAWKFTGKLAQAVIEFGFTKEGEKKVYFIRDNGVGFDMAYADKLFAPFQRLHTDDEFPGTGIGLATVQRIIHRHGGKVWTEGQTGKGATFYFILNE